MASTSLQSSQNYIVQPVQIQHHPQLQQQQQQQRLTSLNLPKPNENLLDRSIKKYPCNYVDSNIYSAFVEPQKPSCSYSPGDLGTTDLDDNDSDSNSDSDLDEIIGEYVRTSDGSLNVNLLELLNSLNSDLKIQRQSRKYGSCDSKRTPVKSFEMQDKISGPSSAKLLSPEMGSSGTDKSLVALKLDAKGSVVFELDPVEAQLIIGLRQKWRALFLRRLRSPGKQCSQQDEAVLSILVAVLTAEEQALGLRQPSGVGARPRPMAAELCNQFEYNHSEYLPSPNLQSEPYGQVQFSERLVQESRNSPIQSNPYNQFINLADQYNLSKKESQPQNLASDIAEKYGEICMSGDLKLQKTSLMTGETQSSRVDMVNAAAVPPITSPNWMKFPADSTSLISHVPIQGPLGSLDYSHSQAALNHQISHSIQETGDMMLTEKLNLIKGKTTKPNPSSQFATCSPNKFIETSNPFRIQNDIQQDNSLCRQNIDSDFHLHQINYGDLGPTDTPDSLTNLRHSINSNCFKLGQISKLPNPSQTNSDNSFSRSHITSLYPTLESSTPILNFPLAYTDPNSRSSLQQQNSLEAMLNDL